MADQHYSRRWCPPATKSPGAHTNSSKRGAEPGHDLDNWLDAERELSRTTTSEVDEPSRGTAARSGTLTYCV